MKENKNDNATFDYLDLIRQIFEKKRLLLFFTGVGLLLGLIVIFTTQREYQSSSFVIIEAGQSASSPFGQMGALAGFAGINIPNMQGDDLQLSSELFPEVIHSRDFLLQLMKEKFYFATKEKEMTLEEFYLEEPPGNFVKKSIDFVIGIPSRILGIFTSSVPEPSLAAKGENSNTSVVEYVSVSSPELYVMGLLKNRISINEKGELLEIRTAMPEPLISAKVNAIVLRRLIEYVTEYKTAKQQRNLEFIQERVKESEAKFHEAQIKLAAFRDANQGVISQRVRTKEEQLQFEFNIAYNIYNSMKQELEQSSIQLKRETPLFTIMERAAIPLGASKPNGPLIFVFSIFLGLFLGIIYCVFQILKSQIFDNNA